MADPKVIIERTYNIPLRKEWLKVPRYKRAKKAMTAVREFLVHHMKSDKVSIGRHINLEVWKRGIRNPPHHIKVDVKKFEDGVVKAELVGAPEEVKKEIKKGSGIGSKIKDAVGIGQAKKKDKEDKPKKEAKKEKEPEIKTETKPEVKDKANPKKEEKEKPAVKKEEVSPQKPVVKTPTKKESKPQPAKK